MTDVRRDDNTVLNCVEDDGRWLFNASIAADPLRKGDNDEADVDGPGIFDNDEDDGGRLPIPTEEPRLLPVELMKNEVKSRYRVRDEIMIWPEMRRRKDDVMRMDKKE